MYKAITSMNKHSTDYVRQRWERDLGLEIMVEDWTHAWETQCSTTNSLTWRDFGWKSLICFFITPKQKSKWTRTQLPCWRECGSMQVDYAHVFWLCPQIRSFWEKTGRLLSKLLGLNSIESFVVLYLGAIPKGLCKGDTYLLKILLVACKKAVTKCWLQINPPSMDLFINTVSAIRSMEMMTLTLRLQKDKGEHYWRKWDCYLGENDTD